MGSRLEQLVELRLGARRRLRGNRSDRRRELRRPLAQRRRELGRCSWWLRRRPLAQRRRQRGGRGWRRALSSLLRLGWYPEPAAAQVETTVHVISSLGRRRRTRRGRQRADVEPTGERLRRQAIGLDSGQRLSGERSQVVALIQLLGYDCVCFQTAFPTSLREGDRGASDEKKRRGKARSAGSAEGRPDLAAFVLHRPTPGL